MALPKEPLSHYREILWKKSSDTPLFRLGDLPLINVYPFPPNIIYGDNDIQPLEGRHPAATLKDLSGNTRVENSVKLTTIEGMGEESLEVNVVTRKGGLLTFEAIKRGPAIRRPGATIDYFLRIRPTYTAFEDSDDGYYKEVDKEGWNEQGLLSLDSPSGMQTFVPSIEYGFRFQEKGNVDKVMVRYPLQQIAGAEGILVNNAVEIVKVNSKSIEGCTTFPENSYFWIHRGESIKCGDAWMFYEQERDVIRLFCEDMYSPHFITVVPPVSEGNKWQEFSQALATTQQERSHAIYDLLNRWNTRMEF